MATLYNRKGSIDDIRNHLRLLTPKNEAERRNMFFDVAASIQDEMSGKNRTTVLKMLEKKKSMILTCEFTIKV